MEEMIESACTLQVFCTDEMSLKAKLLRNDTFCRRRAAVGEDSVGEGGEWG